jgi:predicted phosphodiesterase
MKLQVLSDLHFEVNREFVPQIHPDCDVLVLAGDVGIAGRGHFKTGLHRIQEAITAARLLNELAAATVLFVPGNHEYDRQDWDVAHSEIKLLCEQQGFVFFDHQEIALSGVRLLGITLWSDFGLMGPDMVEKCMSSANRYLLSTGTSRFGAPFKADQVRDLGLENNAWLTERLAHPPAGIKKTVVITHFAPSGQSADPRYGIVPGTASFCNNAEVLLSQADLWIHGHLHCSVDYKKNGCRVLSNPLGYEKKGEQAGFVAQHLIVI